MRKVRFRRILPGLLATTLLSEPARAEMDAAQVLAAARVGYGQLCNTLPPDVDKLADGMIQRFQVMVPGQKTPQPTVVWQAVCDTGAYNQVTAFWVEDAFGGLRPLSFARPVLDVVMERPDDPESPVREVRVTGWTSTTLLANAIFDPATLTFSHYFMARGLDRASSTPSKVRGEASESATWRLEPDGPVIQTLEMDASYDETPNPIQVYPGPSSLLADAIRLPEEQ